MRRPSVHLVALGCFISLVAVCYRTVLFANEQFAYSDSSNLFYPLYQLVQAEWNAGRWPLWNAGQNGGQPLLGNPISAVFYPGKMLFSVFPYAWGARLYVVAHTIVAFVGLIVLSRGCGIGWAGAYLGGLVYAFGAPVLLLYSFVNVQVGAAWVPWGLWAIDHLMRQRLRRGVVELAVVLALQVFGGDPEAAYLTTFCGAGYAVLLAIHVATRASKVRVWPIARCRRDLDRRHFCCSLVPTRSKSLRVAECVRNYRLGRCVRLDRVALVWPFA